MVPGCSRRPRKRSEFLNWENNNNHETDQIHHLRNICRALPAVTAGVRKDLSPKALQQRMVERRAVDALIWGLPLVGEDTATQLFTTTAAARWKAGRPTGCKFRRECRCASSGRLPFTAWKRRAFS
jgi:hypothetical protein